MTIRIRTGAARTLVGLLALLPAAVSAQQQGQGRSVKPPLTPAALGIHGFSVVLVVGSLQGTGATAATEGVPDAAKKALADMKEFLPYKRYQLLDAAWMMCCASARSGVSGRVRGPDERDYRYQVDPLHVSGTKLDMRFTIREMNELSPVTARSGKVSDTASLEHNRQLHEALRERDEAEIQLRRLSQQYEVGVVAGAEMESAKARNARAVQRVVELQRLGGKVSYATSGQNIIDSTFSITPGETVVVGTSRLNGDRALIAILTAAAKPTGAKER